MRIIKMLGASVKMYMLFPMPHELLRNAIFSMEQKIGFWDVIPEIGLHFQFLSFLAALKSYSLDDRN